MKALALGISPCHVPAQHFNPPLRSLSNRRLLQNQNPRLPILLLTLRPRNFFYSKAVSNSLKGDWGGHPATMDELAYHHLRTRSLIRSLIYSFFIIIIIMSGCEKGAYFTTVQGKVINWGSKDPIEGVMVSLRDGLASNGASVDLGLRGNSSYKKSVTYTNNLGEFYIELSGEFEAVLSLSKKGYTFTDSFDGDGVRAYTNGSFVGEILEMKADALFIPVFASKHPTFGTDHLFVEILSQKLSPYQIARGERYSTTGFVENYHGIGPFIYDFPYHSVGDSYLPFRLTCTQQGITNTSIDSVFLKSLVSFKDTIFY